MKLKHTFYVLLLLGLFAQTSSLAAVNESSREVASRGNNNYNNRYDVDSDENYEQDNYKGNDYNDNQYKAKNQNQYQNNYQATHVENNIKVEGGKQYKNDEYEQDDYRPRNKRYAKAKKYNDDYVARGSAYEGGGSYYASNNYYDPYKQISLIPMVGGSWFASRWGDHISNSYTFGLAVEMPFTYYVSGEVEAGYGKYTITYGAGPNVGWKHQFNQFNVGGNLKVYLMKSWIRPYIGAGLMAVDYDGMTRGPRFPLAPQYNQWIGSAQLLAGTDFTVSEGVALGVRGAYLMPVFNRPYTVDNGVYAAPGFEEAAAINTSYYRLMATVKISL